MEMNFEHGLVAQALSPEGSGPNGPDKDKNLAVAAAPGDGDDLNELKDIKGPHKDESNVPKVNENVFGADAVKAALDVDVPANEVPPVPFTETEVDLATREWKNEDFNQWGAQVLGADAAKDALGVEVLNENVPPVPFTDKELQAVVDQNGKLLSNENDKPSRLPLTKDQLAKWEISPDDYLNGFPASFDMTGFTRVTDTEPINGNLYFHAEKDNGKWVLCDKDGKMIGPEFDSLEDLRANEKQVVNENNQ